MSGSFQFLAIETTLGFPRARAGNERKLQGDEALESFRYARYQRVLLFLHTLRLFRGKHAQRVQLFDELHL